MRLPTVASAQRVWQVANGPFQQRPGALAHSLHSLPKIVQPRRCQRHSTDQKGAHNSQSQRQDTSRQDAVVEDVGRKGPLNIVVFGASSRSVPSRAWQGDCPYNPKDGARGHQPEDAWRKRCTEPPRDHRHSLRILYYEQAQHRSQCKYVWHGPQWKQLSEPNDVWTTTCLLGQQESGQAQIYDWNSKNHGRNEPRHKKRQVRW
mmetsp:Transcript_34413/g.92149  ORF Transcript_34413/g.92149 Transcript_34413/m.92149 type:complete len:204 (+) Transcript_34413:92-703(+)